MNKNYSVSIKKLEDSEIEITGEITSDFFESMRAGTIETLGRSVKIDGFRQGHVPEKILVEKVGEMTVLEEMAERAIGEIYPSIITDENIDAIGRPAVSITKIAAKNPLGFIIKQSIMPEVTLPDYRKIASKVVEGKTEVPAVTDEEVEAVITDVRKARATEGEDLPELTDEMAKTFGNFENVDAFKKRIRENIRLEKEHREKEKIRSTIMEALIEKTTLVLPPVIIEREVDAIISELKSNLTQMGLKFEDYLSRIKKTEKEFRDEARPTAEKRAKTGLLLHAISNAEQIVPDKEELDAESDRVLGMYQDADPKAVRHYVEGILKNEAVFKLLEGIK